MAYPIPTQKTLKRICWLDAKQRVMVRKLIGKKVKTTSFQNVQAWVKNCYSQPTYLERLLVALDEVCETSGVECIRDYDEVLVSYLNTGNSYTETLIFRHDLGRFQVMSCGDFVEWWEAKHGRELR